MKLLLNKIAVMIGVIAGNAILIWLINEFIISLDNPSPGPGSYMDGAGLAVLLIVALPLTPWGLLLFFFLIKKSLEPYHYWVLVTQGVICMSSLFMLGLLLS